MKLFLVARYGNDEEGPNGRDTLFLVRSEGINRALGIVERHLEIMPHSSVNAFANWICEVGIDLGSEITDEIILGPVLAVSGISGYRNVWTRDYAEDEWEKLSFPTSNS